MPSRVIRGEILTSWSLSQVSRDAANLFMRLCLAVDEYGRMDGRVSIIHAAVYGGRDDTTTAEVESWIDELREDGCVELYEVGRRPVLRLPGWEEHRAARNRAKASQFPCSCGEKGACGCPPSNSAEDSGPSEEPKNASAELNGEKRSSAELNGLVRGPGVRGSGGQGSGGPERSRAPSPGRKSLTDPPASHADLDADTRHRIARWVREKEPWASEPHRLRDLIDACFDYHAANGKRRADWVRTIQAWIRKERSLGRAPPGPSLAPVHDLPPADVLEQLRAAIRPPIRLTGEA